MKAGWGLVLGLDLDVVGALSPGWGRAARVAHILTFVKLHYTPRSHFSRKVRILIDAWSLDVELEDVGNVADAETFGGHPLMKVPTLVVDGLHLFEADHIARYLSRRYDPDDRFDVLTEDPAQLNARAVLNGIMADEVELILAQRTGLDTMHPRFAKMRRAIESGMAWLESHADLFLNEPSYAGFHLVCMWDHVELYDVVDRHHPRLEERVRRLSAIDFVAASKPR